MGCNTSKDALPPTGEEKEETRERRIEKPDEGITSSTPEDPKSETTESYETNSTTFIKKSIDPVERVSLEEPIKGIEKSTELEEAAVKIQAVFRGHQTRKTMKQPTKQEELHSSQQQLEEEFDRNDKDLSNAATKIQASFRGHMIRKQIDKKENELHSPNKGEHSGHEEEELDIDLSDPDLNKAAVKIQASFRTHMARKDDIMNDK